MGTDSNLAETERTFRTDSACSQPPLRGSAGAHGTMAGMTPCPGSVPGLLTRRAVLAGIGVGAVVAACGRGGGADRELSRPTYVPPMDGSWATVDPTTAGWDVSQLESFAAFARERATKSLLVLHDGRILLERTWDEPGYRRDIASAQKSLMSSLVGVSLAQGELDRDAPVDRYLGQGWSSAPSAAEAGILVRHLLTMTTGLTESLDPVAEPGTTWDYNNTTYQLVRPVLEQATGLGIEPLTRHRLFDPIGVSDRSSWYERPGGGAHVGRPDGPSAVGARDDGPRPRTRVGLLVQREGSWADDEVLPKTELARALRPSQEMNPSYGELWWLNGQSTYMLPQRPTQPGSLVPDAPTDAVAALGKDDQKLYVSRVTGLVLVRLGERASEPALSLSSFDNELWRRLLAAAPE